MTRDPNSDSGRRRSKPIKDPERDGDLGVREPEVGEVAGRIAAVFADRCRVWSEGKEVICSRRGRFKGRVKPVVGDHVRIAPNLDGSGTITEILPRKRELVRRQADRKRLNRPARPQVLAANVDLLVAVASIQRPPLRPGLLDRVLVAAAITEIPVLICVTKLDLDSEDAFNDVRETYRAAGYEVIGTDINRPETLAPLEEALQGLTAVLAGHSGVGKTSLLNALAGRDMATAEVGFHKDRGRHTTSTSRLIPLAGTGRGDTFAIDSPGIREFAPHGIAPDQLAPLYPDFQPHLTGCRFDDCLHRGEPGCALADAVAAGHVAQARYDGYLKLLEELAE